MQHVSTVCSQRYAETQTSIMKITVLKARELFMHATAQIVAQRSFTWFALMILKKKRIRATHEKSSEIIGGIMFCKTIKKNFITLLNQ